MIKDTKKKFKILPALLLCFSLLAFVPKTFAKANESTPEETQYFSVKHVNSCGVIDVSGSTSYFDVLPEHIDSNLKIKIGDKLENCLIIVNKVIDDVADDGFELISKNGNYIKSADSGNKNNQLLFGGIQSESYVFGLTGDFGHQLIYVDGNFGEVSSLDGDFYFYDSGFAYKREPLAVGDKVIGTIFGCNGDVNLFSVDDAKFVKYYGNISISVNGDIPADITNNISVIKNSSDCVVFEFPAPFTFNGFQLTEQSVITEGIDGYKLIEVKNAKRDEPTDGEIGADVPVGGGSGGGTIGNIESTEDQPINLNWLWYVGAGLLLSGCALFVISRR